MGDKESKKGMLNGEPPAEAIKRLHGEMAVYMTDIQGSLALYANRKTELEGYETELKKRDGELQQKEQELSAAHEALDRSNLEYENNLRDYNEQADILNANIDKLHAEQEKLANDKKALEERHKNMEEVLRQAANERKQYMLSEEKKKELLELEEKVVKERSTYECLVKDVTKIDDAFKTLERREAELRAKEDQVQRKQQELMDRELALKGKENTYELKMSEQAQKTTAAAKDENAQLGAALVTARSRAEEMVRKYFDYEGRNKALLDKARNDLLKAGEDKDGFHAYESIVHMLMTDMEKTEAQAVKTEPVVTDDSLVRGTTTKKVIGQLHEQAKAAAKPPTPAAKPVEPAEDVPSYLKQFGSMDEKDVIALSPVLKNYAQNKDYKVNQTGMGMAEIVSYNPKLSKDVEDFYAPKPEPAPKPAEQPKAEEKPPKQRKMKNNPLSK